LETKNTLLKRNLSEENYPQFLDWMQDVSVTGFLYSAKRMSKFKTVAEVKDFLEEEKDEIFWEIYDRRREELIGYTSLCSLNKDERSVEFSVFIFNKKYWGKGYGKEVGYKMVDYVFKELRLDEIRLETCDLHKNAILLYEKLGFKKTKLIPKDRIVFVSGEWIKAGSLQMVLKKEVIVVQDTVCCDGN